MVTRDDAEINPARAATAERAVGRSAGALAAALGSLLAALGAASCCVVPFVLATVGVGGAWLANLTALAPYQPYVAALALTLVGGGFVLTHRQAQPACADGASCARPASRRMARIGLWIATALLATALGSPYLARLFIDV